MIVEQVFDVREILLVLTDDDIFDAISEDTATIKDLKVDVLTDYWLSVVVGDEIIGVVQFKPIFNRCFDSHIHILPKYRKAYSEEAGRKILDWCEDKLKGSVLYTNVPVFCGNVKNYLLAFGFSERGTLPNVWRKNGEMNDMTILTKEI